MSITDYALCLGFYTPCSASCIPRKICPSSIKEALSQSNIGIIRDVASADCKNVLDTIPICFLLPVSRNQ